MLLAQEAKITPITNLGQLGITNIQFKADLENDQFFVIELRTEKNGTPDYTRWLYSTIKNSRIDMPILETHKFFAPNENNRIVIKTPMQIFTHKNGMLEGVFGGKEFTFKVTEQDGKGGEDIYTYSFRCYLLPRSEAPENIQKQGPEIIYFTAQKNGA
jgi:hypothetical protein